VDCDTEIRLFDPRRKPQNWTEVIRPTECAVFLKDRATSSSLSPDGHAYPSPSLVTCIVFNRLDATQRFCEEKVQALPQLRCEIYDAQGLAHPPLAVILHPESQRKEDAGPIWSRRRKWGAGALSLISLLLFWVGMCSSNSGDLAIFLSVNYILVALRLKRLEEHRPMERSDA
jgi:hypothetical protein